MKDDKAMGGGSTVSALVVQEQPAASRARAAAAEAILAKVSRTSLRLARGGLLAASLFWFLEGFYYCTAKLQLDLLDSSHGKPVSANRSIGGMV